MRHTAAAERRARRLRRIVIAVTAFLATAGAVLLVAGAQAKAALRARYPPPGSLVDLGGYRLHLYCEGSGSPTVILEAGVGDPAVKWERVRPDVARVTRTCAYDRAGLGWSDASPTPRTAENIVSELHALLSRAPVEGPYILVGHSLGGALVRLYAHTYPQGVAGMVLVDSAHEDQFSRFPAAVVESADRTDRQIEREANHMRPYVRLGVAALVIDRFPFDLPLPPIAVEAYRSFFAVDTRMKDTEVAEVHAFRGNLARIRAAHITTVGNIPLLVLTHGRPDRVFSDPAVPEDARQQAEIASRQMQSELARLSPQGQLVVAKESGHYIQLDEPRIVIEAIERVVKQVRDDAARRAAPVADRAS